jgi:hypothetical protein
VLVAGAQGGTYILDSLGEAIKSGRTGELLSPA